MGINRTLRSLRPLRLGVKPGLCVNVGEVKRNMFFRGNELIDLLQINDLMFFVYTKRTVF